MKIWYCYESGNELAYVVDNWIDAMIYACIAYDWAKNSEGFEKVFITK